MYKLGFGMMAVALYGLAISLSDTSDNWFSARDNRYAERIYALHNPVYDILIAIILTKVPQKASSMINCDSLIMLGQGSLRAVFGERE